MDTAISDYITCISLYVRVPYVIHCICVYGLCPAMVLYMAPVLCNIEYTDERGVISLFFEAKPRTYGDITTSIISVLSVINTAMISARQDILFLTSDISSYFIFYITPRALCEYIHCNCVYGTCPAMIINMAPVLWGNAYKAQLGLSMVTASQVFQSNK